MSDVNAAPPPASAPAPAPANEVAINPNPVASPTPVGSQAPEAPVGDKPPSRRDSIRKAFEKTVTPGTEAKAPARAKAPKAQPRQIDPENAEIDLKKPVSAQKERHREQGRFARAPQADDQQGQLPLGQRQQPGLQSGREAPVRPAAPLPETAAYRDPPPRFSERGKAEWAAAPESVRGEIHRMAKEFDGAYRRYREDHEAMEPIRQFHEMAREHGTSLDKALTNYVSMEHKLREDVVGGLDVIVNNLNLRTSEGQKIGLRDVAYHILNMSPDQQRITQSQNAQTAASHQIGALHQEVTGLKQALSQMHNQQQFSYTRSAVDQFADMPGHERFDELGDLIEQELNVGYDLPTAYRRAELLRPRTHAAQTRNPSAQTRPEDKSISGAPASGPSDGQRRDSKKVGRRDAIATAFRQVNGGA